MANDEKKFGTVTVTDLTNSHVFDNSVAYSDGRGGLCVKDAKDRPVGIFASFQSVIITYKQEA